LNIPTGIFPVQRHPEVLATGCDGFDHVGLQGF